MLTLVTYADACIPVNRGAHRPYKTRKTHKGHFFLIENHFQQRIAGYEKGDEGTFSWKYLPSRFDKLGCLRWTSAFTKITLSWSEISTKCRSTMRVPSVKQDLPKHGTCGSMQRFCSREATKVVCLGVQECLWKSVLWEEGLCWKGAKQDGAWGPTEGFAYSSPNVWSPVGKGRYAGFPMHGFAWKTRCSSFGHFRPSLVTLFYTTFRNNALQNDLVRLAIAT